MAPLLFILGSELIQYQKMDQILTVIISKPAFKGKFRNRELVGDVTVLLKRLVSVRGLSNNLKCRF